MSSISNIKRFLFLAIGCLTYLTSYSQENFIPGLIIKANKDTINGLVDYRNWEKNPNFINFKESIDAIPSSYSPMDILEFRVKDEIYVAAIILTEVSPFKLSDLDEDPQLNTKLDTTFLQTLFKGKKELYLYRNKERKGNFYIKQNGQFELLQYKKYQKLQNGKKSVVQNNKYLGQLTLYLDDCPNIQYKLQNVSYQENSLYKLFQYYVECSQSDISFQKDEAKVTKEVGVLAGTSLSTINFESANFPYLVQVDYNNSVNVTAGVFLDLIFPRNHGKWSINNELLFTTYKFEGVYEEYENENSYSTTTIKIGNSYLKLNTLIRFKYPIGSTFLFINGGMSNGLAVNTINYKKTERTFYFDKHENVGPILEETSKYENGLILGTGIKYNNLSVEIRAESGGGMSKYSSLSSTVMRYFLLVGYRF